MEETEHYRTVRRLLEEIDLPFRPRRFDFDALDFDVKEHIAKNLAHLRKRKGFTQSSFAKKLGISLSQYKKYESAREIIRLDIAQFISIQFGYTLFQLVEGSQYETMVAHQEVVPESELLTYLTKSLLDEHFERLLVLLMQFVDDPKGRKGVYAYSGVDAGTFDAALTENKQHIYQYLADGILAVRKHYGLTQEYIADIANVSVSTYQSYESPDHDPKFNMMAGVRYCAAMQLHPYVVMHDTFFVKIRAMQNTRIALVKDVLATYDDDTLKKIGPLIEGFHQSIQAFPGAVLF